MTASRVLPLFVSARNTIIGERDNVTYTINLSEENFTIVDFLEWPAPLPIYPSDFYESKYSTDSAQKEFSAFSTKFSTNFRSMESSRTVRRKRLNASSAAERSLIGMMKNLYCRDMKTLFVYFFAATRGLAPLDPCRKLPLAYRNPGRALRRYDLAVGSSLTSSPTPRSIDSAHGLCPPDYLLNKEAARRNP